MPKLSINKFVILLVYVFIYSCVKPQLSDNDLILNKTNIIQEFEKQRQVTYLFKNKSLLIKYNPVSLFFGGMLYVYQKYISVQIAAQCPYEISCSAFSKTCIQKYGLLYGIPLTADRLTRCTRLASFDLIRGIEYNSKTNVIYDNPDNYHLFKHSK